MGILVGIVLVILTSLAGVIHTSAYPRARVGGPFFYADGPGGNPVREERRLRAFQAAKARRVWWAWYDNNGRLTKLIFKEGKVEQKRVEFAYNRGGELMFRRFKYPNGYVVEEWFRK